MSSILPSPSIQMARSLSQLQPQQLVEMSALDLLEQQLESGSTEAAVDAMKRLGVVAVLSGPEAVEQRLLPYLTQLVLQPSKSSENSTSQSHPDATLSDEMLLIMGQQLPAVANVLADPSKVPEFIPLLEKLAAVEETVVRDQAVIVLQNLCARSADGKDEEAVSPWMALVKRLSGADWFTAKVSCAGIVASVFALVKAINPEATSQQYELLTLYKELCADDTPMVRRAAAQHLGACLETAGWPQRDFAAVQVAALGHDEQDSVRLLAVASIAMAGPDFASHPTWTIQHWLPMVKDGSTDMSWCVTCTCAMRCEEDTFFWY